MSDFIALENGLVISDDGEIIDGAGINDPLAFLVRKRHEAHQQEKEWETYRKTLDAVILRQQHDKRLSYENVVSTIAGGTYSTTDAGKFADALAEAPLEVETIFETIAAASGFKRELLPAKVRDLYDDATTTHEKRPWVVTSEVRQQAPKPRKVQVETKPEEPSWDVFVADGVATA